MNETPAWALHGMHLGIKTIIGYGKAIQYEATRTTPIHATWILHAQSVGSMLEIQGKSIFCVHMQYSADWIQSM